MLWLKTLKRELVYYNIWGGDPTKGPQFLGISKHIHSLSHFLFTPSLFPQATLSPSMYLLSLGYTHSHTPNAWSHTQTTSFPSPPPPLYTLARSSERMWKCLRLYRGSSSISLTETHSTSLPLLMRGFEPNQPWMNEWCLFSWMWTLYIITGLFQVHSTKQISNYALFISEPLKLKIRFQA